jgi:hypothetical protein
MLSVNTMVKSKILRLHSAYTLSPENTCDTQVVEWQIQHGRKCAVGLTCYNNKLQLGKYIISPDGPHTAGLIDTRQDAVLGQPSRETESIIPL